MLPLFDPKIGPKKVRAQPHESFLDVIFGCYFILEVFYSNSTKQELSFAAKFMSIGHSLSIL